MTEPSTPATPSQLLAYLEELGIETRTVTHPAVFTVDEAKRLRGKLPGAHSKSLFLRNKKGRMWLVVALEDRPIDLKALGERLEAGRLSFGSPERLMRYLGVIPGAVTPFGAINDQDRRRADCPRQGDARRAPCSTSTRSTTPRRRPSLPDGLIRFLEATGHSPELIDFSV